MGILVFQKQVDLRKHKITKRLRRPTLLMSTKKITDKKIADFTRVNWLASNNFSKLKAAADARMNGDCNIDNSIPACAIERTVEKMRVKVEDSSI